jgi:hypothetical protein
MRAGAVKAKIAALAAAGLTAVGIGIAWATPAHADGYDFLYHADRIGISGTSLNVGYGVCGNIANSWSQRQIAEKLVHDSWVGQGYNGITYSQARDEVYWAWYDLCPGYRFYGPNYDSTLT